MTTRIFIAGVVGGIVMFIWTFIAHMFLPLGEAGISPLPNESQILDVLKSNLPDNYKSLYVFPWVDPSASADAKAQMMEKIASGPSGLLMYHPRRTFNFPKRALIELAKEILEAVLAVFLLSSTRLLSAGSRILFVTILGVIAAIATNVSYWNWYGFPKRYTLSYMFVELVGFFLVGVVSALLLRNRDPVAESNPA